MKKYRYIIAAFALCAIAACSEDDFNVPTDAVRIDATIGDNSIFTRSNPASTTDDDETRFNPNDQISVTNVDRTATYTLTKSGWVANGNDYLRWYKEPLTFTARYPAGNDVGDKMSFTLETGKTADQSTLANIGNADFMVCRTPMSARPKNNTLTLQMQRMMARIIVRIEGFEDEFGAGAEVENVTITSPASIVNVEFNEDNPSAKTDGTAIDIKPYMANGTGGTNTTYTAIVIPANYSDATVVKLKCGDKEDLEAKVTLEVKAGHSYTLPLTVGKETIKIGEVSVADWKGNVTIEGGTANETTKQ